MSDIRVFVTFPKSATGGAIFSGETLECKITFRNVSPIPGARPLQPQPLPTNHPPPHQPIYTQSHLQHQIQQPPYIQTPQANGAAAAGRKPVPVGTSGSSASDRARAAAISPRIPQGQTQPTPRPEHKPSLSLSVPGEKKGSTTPKLPSATPASCGNGNVTASSPGGQRTPGQKHQRSISVVSISSELGGDEVPHQRGASIGNVGGATGPPSARGTMRRGGHSRSASLQFSPRVGGASPAMPISASFAKTPPIPATPMIVEAGDTPMTKFSFPAKRGTPATPSLQWTAGSVVASGGGGHRVGRHGHSESLAAGFKFPPGTTQGAQGEALTSSEPQSAVSQDSVGAGLGPKVTNIDLRSPGGSEDESLHNGSTGGHEQQQHRQILGLGINGDTPRSSGEFYSLANSTTETLISEYDPRLATNRLHRPQPGRRQSLLGVGNRSPETLMMGYAQVMGSFTLDASLVHTAPFEEIKRKGVVGGQGGGGVVGIDHSSSKAEGKFLSSFGWGSFGGAIGGLLGGNSMSSMADMKNLASQKSIPILSTPQSILFVDLRLGPGEERSYEFKFPLPKRLPPSHRGKAIKVQYILKIGTQRAGKGVQPPKVVEIPFRVFPYVDANGSYQVHDLMQPIILLKDEAKVTCVEEQQQQQQTPPTTAIKRNPTPSPGKDETSDDSSLIGFLAYVDTLITPNSAMNLRSPSSFHNGGGSIPGTPFGGPPSLTKSKQRDAASSRENIEIAILRGGLGAGGGVGGARMNGAGMERCSIFEIARNGHKVASLTLARPAYKLGDTITAVIDFQGAAIPCYHVHATLESTESITPQLALRSPSSIMRATRKIHAAHSESCLFAHRVLFSPTIPPSASPEFTTSCVALTWRLNIEFITPALLTQSGAAAEVDEQELLIDGLLERAAVAGGSGGKREGGGDKKGDRDRAKEIQLERERRGEIWEPKQGVLVESFDAHIPVRVYPNVRGCDAGQGVVGGWGFGSGFSGVDEEGYAV